jgi:hypothetical protein
MLHGSNLRGYNDPMLRGKRSPWVRICLKSGLLLLAVGGYGSSHLVAGPIVQLTYTQNLDIGAPLNIPSGSFASWTATLDLSTHDYFPTWTLTASTLPPGLTAKAPINIFWSVDPVTLGPVDAITGVVPGSFTWQGLTYLGAYTIQFPRCPVPSGPCTATTLGQYYYPGYFTYSTATYDTLRSEAIPEPNAGFLLLCPVIFGWALFGLKRAKVPQFLGAVERRFGVLSEKMLPEITPTIRTSSMRDWRKRD